MTNIKQILIIILLLTTSCNRPIDIRNEYLKKGINENDIQKGKELLNKMELAYGGKEEWDKYRYGEFKQKADWYGRTKLSHWDTIPQLFKMKCELGSNDSEMVLLNGKNKGVKYWIENDTFKEQQLNQEKVETDQNKYYEKMVFKNYWFQFPFRIREAQIISYGGEEELNGKSYNLLYATWGNEEANTDYDQFILYLDKTTDRIEILYFTVRDKMKRISLTAEFKDFKPINNFNFPHSQFVRYGKPSENGIKFHENHYLEISFQEK